MGFKKGNYIISKLGIQAVIVEILDSNYTIRYIHSTNIDAVHLSEHYMKMTYRIDYLRKLKNL